MSLAHYLLQVNIYLVLFFALYKILLAKETYFLFNRIYLIAATLLSLLIPFIQIDWFKQQTISEHMPIRLDQLDVMVGSVVLEPVKDQFNWGGAIVTIYILGIVFMLLKFVFKLIAVKQAFKTSSGSAFSFLKHKVVDKSLPSYQTIDTHEEVHVKQLHTVDILLFEILGIINWFNPVMYFYRSEIKDIHEYLADEAAAAYQGDKETYALLLLSQAFGVNPRELTNGFFTKSMIKKRIYMLHKHRSKRAAILKYGLSVPLFAIMLLLSSSTIRKNKKLLAIADEVPVEKAAAAVDYVKKSIVFGDVIKEIEQAEHVQSNQTSSENNWRDFYRFLSNHIDYPQSASMYDVEGTVVSEIKIKDGQIIDFETRSDVGYGVENEIRKSVESYHGNLPGDGTYTFNTAFKLIDEDEALTRPKDANIVILAPRPKKEDRVYHFVFLDNPPSYPGGMSKFYEYLAHEIKYPNDAVENQVQGNVFASFIVETDGSLSDIKIERKLGYGTDEEAVRVLKASSNWIPGMIDGEPVRVKYNIPIKFALNKRQDDIKKVVNVRSNNDLSNAKGDFLLVVDGKIQSHNDLSGIKSEDIASINVLKDASAIVSYGKRGINGVVSVRTKTYKGPNE